MTLPAGPRNTMARARRVRSGREGLGELATGAVFGPLAEEASARDRVGIRRGSEQFDRRLCGGRPLIPPGSNVRRLRPRFGAREELLEVLFERRNIRGVAVLQDLFAGVDGVAYVDTSRAKFLPVEAVRGAQNVLQGVRLDGRGQPGQELRRGPRRCVHARRCGLVPEAFLQRHEGGICLTCRVERRFHILWGSNMRSGQ
jgi:hypothetical protein